MFEIKIFFLKFVVKGSCRLVEFRVSLEKKRMDGKVFIYMYEKYNLCDLVVDLVLIVKEKFCNGRVCFRFFGCSLIFFWFDVERCFVGFDCFKCIIIIF